MTKRVYAEGDAERIERALGDLRTALKQLRRAGARKTAERVRAAISSCKGAVRNAYQLQGKLNRL